MGTINLVLIIFICRFFASENPLKQENRKYPIEIGSSTIEKYTVNLEIPEEYSVEYVPEPIKLQLPEGFGSYYYAVSPVENGLEVIRNLELSKPIYSVEEAELLRQVFLKMVEVESEKVILSKKD